jgi:hypothetical protein
MPVNEGGIPPILAQRHCGQPYVMLPENLLREACGQERIMDSRLPDICASEPDGDIVRNDGLRPRLLR